MQACPNNKRDKKTLLSIINDKVLWCNIIVVFITNTCVKVEKGSTIYTDGWQAYKTLTEEGFLWDWVNHSGKSS